MIWHRVRIVVCGGRVGGGGGVSEGCGAYSRCSRGVWCKRVRLTATEEAVLSHIQANIGEKTIGR